MRTEHEAGGAARGDALPGSRRRTGGLTSHWIVRVVLGLLATSLPFASAAQLRVYGPFAEVREAVAVRGGTVTLNLRPSSSRRWWAAAWTWAEWS